MSDLDDLLTDDPLNLSSRNIDEIVAFYRKRREAGKAPTAAKPEGSTIKISLSDLGLKKPVEPVKRRI